LFATAATPAAACSSERTEVTETTPAGQSISAVVMTLNEQNNLEYCLRSIRPWADEIIVVDMRSEDGTAEIARRYADTVLEHERIEGFDAGRERGFDEAAGDWIFSIDADEVVPARLGRWVREFIASDPDFDVVLIPRANVFLGRWLRSSPWWPGKPRLFRRGRLKVSSTLHAGLQPVPGARIKRLPKDPRLSMWHFAHPSIEAMTAKTNRYTSIEARQALAAGQGDPGIRELLWGPLRAAAVYAAKLGPRDGVAGLIYAVDRAYYGFMAAAKRWDEARIPARQGEYDRMREELIGEYETSAAADAEALPGRSAAQPEREASQPSST
jgi:glycosyltransferase involved in cell wall biosynthesis